MEGAMTMRAERRFRDVVAKLAAAATPPPEPGKSQRRLPL
jgi:hypothetical protein